MVKTIKEIHERDLTLIRIGTFYVAYGKDAYIMSYLFGYKIKSVDSTNYPSCGFPVGSINKIKTVLESKKVNYVLLSKSDNYEVEEIDDNKKLNTYEELYERTHKYIRLKDRIGGINNYLIDNVNQDYIKNLIFKIEEIIDESRQVSSY